MKHAEIREALRIAGFGLIQDEIAGADVIAWASNESGELVPWAVVEEKTWPKDRSIRPELGLSQLARARSKLGSQEHYVVANGQWFRADRALRTLERVDGPSRPPFGSNGEVKDVEAATDLIRDQLLAWGTHDGNQGRDQSTRKDESNSPAMAYSKAVQGLHTDSGDVVPASREVMWEARRRAMVEAASQKDAPLYSSHPAVARAVAHLIGSKLTASILDPFCGTGSFLWECIDRALELHSGLVAAQGYDISPDMTSLSASIAEGAPIPVTIGQRDSLHPFVWDGEGGVPKFAAVVAAPPFGVRLDEQYELIDGSHTTDGDVASLDTVLRFLAPEGRAVVHLPRAITFRRNSESYRWFLADNFRVAAVIGLPPGAIPDTAISSVLLIIEHSRPTTTFIAQLGEDWQSQLDVEGAALEQALEHIEGLENGPGR